MKESGLLVGSVSWRCQTSRVSHGKEAEHGAYSILRGNPTRIRRCLYRPDLPDLRPARLGLVLVPPPPLRDRTHPVQWLGPQGPSQLLSPLLQPCRLVARHLVAVVGALAGSDLCPRGSHRISRRRYSLPQTRTDTLRRGHASRSAPLQPGLEGRQLGTRLGRRVLDPPLSVVVAYQSVVPAGSVPPVQKSPGPDQGAQGLQGPARSQPSYAPPTGRGDDSPVCGLVCRPPVPGHRRQRLRRQERAAAAAGQCRPDQPCPS